jgi:hypothetical protein
MEYITEVIDRRSGELATVRLGDWKTVSELAADYDTGPNEFRHVLITMGLLQSEGAQGRRRLTPEAVALGYGKRIEPRRGSKFKYPSVQRGSGTSRSTGNGAPRKLKLPRHRPQTGSEPAMR